MVEQASDPAPPRGSRAAPKEPPPPPVTSRSATPRRILGQRGTSADVVERGLTHGRKRKVNIALPVALSRRFTTRAEQQDRYLSDMVMEAFWRYADELSLEEPAPSGSARRPRRRSVSSGRIIHMVYLTATEVAAIDDTASGLGLSRSAFVAAVLDRYLGSHG